MCCRIWRQFLTRLSFPGDLGEGRIVGCGNGVAVCVSTNHMAAWEFFGSSICPTQLPKEKGYVLSSKADQKGYHRFYCQMPRSSLYKPRFNLNSIYHADTF